MSFDSKNDTSPVTSSPVTSKAATTETPTVTCKCGQMSLNGTMTVNHELYLDINNCTENYTCESEAKERCMWYYIYGVSFCLLLIN